MGNLKIEIKWALTFAVISLLWMWLENSLGLHAEKIADHAMYTSFFAIPAITLYVLALLDKRKNHYHGEMTYKQGLISGIVITIFVAILSPLTQYITTTFISPEYYGNAIAYSVSIGEMTQAEAERYFNLQSYIIQAFFGALVMGVVTSAIVAIFTRRNPQILTAGMESN